MSITKKTQQTVRSRYITFVSICIILLGLFLIYSGLSFLLNLDYFVETTKEIAGRFSKTLTQEEISKLRISLRNDFIRGLTINSVVGLSCIVAGIGLLKLKRWAWRFTILMLLIAIGWFTYDLFVDIYKYNSLTTLPLKLTLIVIFIILFISFRFKKISTQFIK
jgi:hypothetical protein